MSDSASDASTAEFSLLWRGASTLCGSKIQNKKTEPQMSVAETSPQRKGEFADLKCFRLWIKVSEEELSLILATRWHPDIFHNDTLCLPHRSTES